MKTIAVVRGDNKEKVRTALHDLIVYANLTFESNARIICPSYADEILVLIMKQPLKEKCKAAAAVILNEDAKAAIGRIRKIHPPAHIVIVSSRYFDIYEELLQKIDTLEEIELDLESDVSDEFEFNIKTIGCQ